MIHSKDVFKRNAYPRAVMLTPESTTGNFTVDFQTMQTRDPEYLHRYSATGSGTAILANRISYIFDLRGPRYVAKYSYPQLNYR